MIKSKKGISAWIWILIAIIVVAVLVYLFIPMDLSSIFSGEGSAPKPPALPTG